MKRILITASIIFSLACNNTEGPDVSGIRVDITIHRFDRFLYEKLDTNNIQHGMAQVQQQFPFFAADFFQNILGLPFPVNGSIDTAATHSFTEIKRFLTLTRPLYDSLAPLFSNTHQLQKELEQGFQHVRYYFPSYQVPQVVTYIGPFDAPAIAITSKALAIGLQLYGGRNFSFYTSDQGQEIYPRYISTRFEPAYITSNAMKAIAEDIYPDQASGRPLIEQMITRGKQWYLLDKFLPQTADSLKTGYTAKQLAWCRENEGVIWNSFLQNNDLYTTEPFIIKNYIGEAPTTEGMPAVSPGNIGQWVGWQIVKAYAASHPDIKPDQVIKTDPKIVFKESRYRPK